LKDTANEIRKLNRAKAVAGRLLCQRISEEQRAALGLEPFGSTDASAAAIFDACVSRLQAFATEKVEERRAAALARSPLVSSRYVATLARSLAATWLENQTARTLENIGEVEAWHYIEKRTLDTAYMLGTVAQLNRAAAHPGSVAGRVIVDTRNLSDFADRDGKLVTLASIRARLAGEARP
jgi:hypothetical protein